MRVLVETVDAAAVVTINDPGNRNAMDLELAREFAAAVVEASTDPAVCGVVVTGNGAFCAGGNLRAVVDRIGLSAEEHRRLIYDASQAAVRAIIESPVPVFAAVDGAAVGMGVDIALAADTTFVGPDGWLMQGWGRVGLVPATGGELLLRRRNPSVLWKLLEEQQQLSNADCERLALGEAVYDQTARDRALDRVQRLATMSRAALEAYVAVHRADIRAALGPHQALALGYQLDLLASPDFPGRVAAVLQH